MLRRNSWELTEEILEDSKAAMKKTKSEVWDGYVLAALPALVEKFGGEASSLAILLANELVKARDGLFGDQAYDLGPLEPRVMVAENTSELRGDLEGAHDEAMKVFRADEASMGLRGKAVAAALKHMMTKEEVYAWLEVQVREGRLWAELTREKIVAFGVATNAHVVVYHDPEVARDVMGAEFAEKVRDGIIIQPDFDRAKIPGWVKTLMNERVRKRVRAARMDRKLETVEEESQQGGAA